MPSMFILLGWFERWEVSGCTAAVLWHVASRTFLKQHLAFSPCILLAPRWCIHTVVPTQLQFGRNSFLFYLRSDFCMINNLSIAVHTFAIHMLTLLSVDEILVMMYCTLLKIFLQGDILNKYCISCGWDLNLHIFLPWGSLIKCTFCTFYIFRSAK